jgi:cbb3-type cytochrome oxidase subunit 3
MDVNLIRELVTLCGLILFAALTAWVYWPARREAFDTAAQLPFAGEIDPAAGGPRDE